MRRTHLLTEQEKAILESKATEPPFSGSLLKETKLGIYLCKKCDAPLYLSSTKFDSHCGWPSFDEELPYSVLRKPDVDRLEVVCNRCQGHLGHVFTGEHFTEKETRHCINSLSLRFLSAHDPYGFPLALFAAENSPDLQNYFQKIPGVLRAEIGYVGGLVVNPTHEEFLSGETGHVQAVRIAFDPDQIHYQDLVSDFFTAHLPHDQKETTPHSWIFYFTESQALIASRIKKALERKIGPLATTISPASWFYPARLIPESP